MQHLHTGLPHVHSYWKAAISGLPMGHCRQGQQQGIRDSERGASHLKPAPTMYLQQLAGPDLSAPLAAARQLAAAAGTSEPGSEQVNQRFSCHLCCSEADDCRPHAIAADRPSTTSNDEADISTKTGGAYRLLKAHPQLGKCQLFYFLFSCSVASCQLFCPAGNRSISQAVLRQMYAAASMQLMRLAEAAKASSHIRPSPSGPSDWVPTSPVPSLLLLWPVPGTAPTCISSVAGCGT